MSQFSGEEKVQIFTIIVMLFIIIRTLMKMPKKLRIIVAISMVVMLGIFVYMSYYQPELYELLTHIK